MASEHDINTLEHLRAVIGEPPEMLALKVRPSLEEAMLAFIARSPLVFIATRDADDLPDISPKGDAPGFVKLGPYGQLLIPDRPGNKLVFGFSNLLVNPAIGLIFVVPGMRETLRVKGAAMLTTEPGVLQALEAQGKPAIICTRVKVSECFFHCGKAMIRSKLWQPDHWQNPGESLLVRQMADNLELGEDGRQFVENALEQNYVDELY